MTTGGQNPDDDGKPKAPRQSPFSSNQPRVQVLPVTQSNEPPDPSTAPTTTSTTNSTGEEQDAPLLTVEQQRMVEDSTKRVVNQVAKSLNEDHVIKKLNTEIAYYQTRASETEDPIKTQINNLKDVKEQQKKLYQEAQGLREDIKSAKAELNAAKRAHTNEENLFNNLKKQYDKEPTAANKDIMDKSKQRLEQKTKNVESLKGGIESKQNELKSKIPLRDSLREKSAALKKDLAEKDPGMKEFLAKQTENEKKHAQKKAALNKYTPEGKVQKLKAAQAKNKERIKGIEQNPPKIGDYHDGAELLGAMIAWLLMMLLALLGRGINKAVMHAAEKALNNKKPMLKDMKKLADKRYDLAQKIDDLEKKAPLNEADQKKLDAMKEKLAKMDEGLEAYQKRLAKIREFKGERNQINEDAALQKKAAAQEDLTIGQAYQKDIGNRIDFIKDEMTKNQEAINQLKASGPLDDTKKEQLQKLEQQKEGLEANLKAANKEKDNADKLVNQAQARIDEADKELQKVRDKELKNTDQEAKEAKILNKDSGVDLGNTAPQEPQLSSTVDTPVPTTSTVDTVLEVQHPPQPQEVQTPLQTNDNTQNTTPLAQHTDSDPAPLVSQTDANPAPLVQQTDANPAPLVQQTDSNPAPLVQQTDANPAPLVSQTDSVSPPLQPPQQSTLTSSGLTIDPPRPQVQSSNDSGANVSPSTTQSTSTLGTHVSLDAQFDAIILEIPKLEQEIGSLLQENEALQGVSNDDLGPSSTATFGAKAPHANDKVNIKQEVIEAQKAQKAQKPGEKGTPTAPKVDTSKSTSTTTARH